MKVIHALIAVDSGEGFSDYVSYNDKIVLTPNKKKDGLTVDLYGDWVGILSMSVRHQYNDQQKVILVDKAK